MKNLKLISVVLLILASLNTYAQQKNTASVIKISGNVIEKMSKQSLEYATITFTNGTSTKAIAGGITNPKGEFSIDVPPGTYDIKIEFISFRFY